MTIEPRQNDVERNLALLAYGLMFFAIFLSGLPALIAVIIAYSRRKDKTASPLVLTHYGFMVWVFWIGCGLALLTAAAGIATIFASLIQLFGHANLPALNSWTEFQTRIAGSSSVALFLISTAVLFALTGLWLAGSSAYGFIRLASGLPMSETSAPIRR